MMLIANIIQNHIAIFGLKHADRPFPRALRNNLTCQTLSFVYCLTWLFSLSRLRHRPRSNSEVKDQCIDKPTRCNTSYE